MLRLTKFFFRYSWAGFAIKASGLAGGKGVSVVSSKREARCVLESFKSEGSVKMKKALETIVIEEKLVGFEISVTNILGGFDGTGGGMTSCFVFV